MNTRTGLIAAALAMGGSLSPLSRLPYARKSEKYPGQRTAYLKGAWRGDGVASKVRRAKPHSR